MVLLKIFQELGLYEFLNFKCDWNTTVARQIYAIIEISHESQKIEWMTGSRKYEASFRDFASAL